MKVFRVFTAATEPQPGRCDAACRDRGRRERLHDAAAQNAIRI
jgi:hypothetical protein